MVIQPTASPTRLLRFTLYDDALFCALFGIGSIVTAESLPSLLGVGSATFFLALGAVVLVWTGWLLLIASRPALNLHTARIPFVGNIAWAGISAVLLASGLLPFTSTGAWMVGVIAVIVVGYAAALFVGLRRAWASTVGQHST